LIHLKNSLNTYI